MNNYVGLAFTIIYFGIGAFKYILLFAAFWPLVLLAEVYWIYKYVP